MKLTELYGLLTGMLDEYGHLDVMIETGKSGNRRQAVADVMVGGARVTFVSPEARGETSLDHLPTTIVLPS